MKVKNQYLKILEYLHLRFNEWPSMKYNLWVSLVYWNQLTWQWSRIRSLTPSTKRVIHSITERGGCSRSPVSKHMKCKVDWKKEIGLENVHQQQGWPQAWEYYQVKLIQTLGRASQGVNWSWSQCIKSHHAQTSSGKGLRSHFWNRNIVRSILPGLRRKRTGLLLSGPKTSFQMKVNLAFQLEIKVPESRGRVERHRIHVDWSPVWNFHSQWWFGLSCHLLVLVHCVFWSPQATQPSTRTF